MAVHGAATRVRLFCAAVLPFLLTLLQSPLHAQDAARLRQAARSAEAAYERTTRWLAPTTFAGGSAECEEVVGRFCLTFDTLHKPPVAPPRREVAAAREKAIGAARSFFARAPGDLDAAAPLVRLLIEAGRAGDAVAAAREFALHTDSAVWREWLPGYALHAAGEDSLAWVHLERGVAQLSAAEREHVLSIEWLLDPDERGRLRRLNPAARAAYVQRFWSVADPRLATAVNEAQVQHLARHVEARIRARIPRVAGMVAWGRDLEQLTVRYGAPAARERVVGRSDASDSYIEHFDTTALAYAPRSLLRTGLPAPRPGERWPLAERAPRSAHAIPSLRRVLPLVHQATRYPHGDSMRVRVDLALPDSAGGALTALLQIRDRSGHPIAERRLDIEPTAPGATLELIVPRDTVLYGAEIHDAATGRLLRARYQLEPLGEGALQLSDVLITKPIASDSAAPPPAPLTDLRLLRAQVVGMHAEIHGLQQGAPYDVSVAFVRADRPPALARGLRWLGEQVGLVRREVSPHVRWQDRAGDVAAVSVNVTAPARTGWYLLDVTVRSQSGHANSRRLVRVIEVKREE